MNLVEDKTMRNVFAVCVAGLLIAQPASANDKKEKWIPDTARGQGTSERLCTNCHLVKPGQSGSAIAGVPSFAAIANRPDQSSERIANILVQSHPPMPTMSLTRNEILDIIAYLDTLRDAGVPLIEKTPTPHAKPKYPDQS